ncbi:MAG: hypothetical protein IJM32_04530 [Ruminococcus sp.]|nr:hypothetical protein [Ruminococcus sp.]
MRGIITVLATDADLSVGWSFFDEVLLILFIIIPIAAFFASLLCMRARKWKAAAVIAILLALYSIVTMFICKNAIMLLPLAYSMLVCGIVYDRTTKEKRLQQSDSQGAALNDHTDK